MEHFEAIKQALLYIDRHLHGQVSYEMLAKRFHFSPYYFYRMFTLIVGKPIHTYTRERRLQQACSLLAGTSRSILDIGLACGFESAPAFSRAFKSAYGISPRAYRVQGFRPDGITVDEMIIRFTNRIKGGILLKPRIIKEKHLLVAGITGPGEETAAVWNRFERTLQEHKLENSLKDSGFEIRTHSAAGHYVHVGRLVSSGSIPEAYTLFTLPAGTYASFDVYVSRGYMSENDAMVEWLATNEEGYRERLLGGKHFVVEYYDERFNGEEAGSVVEIWVPVEKDA